MLHLLKTLKARFIPWSVSGSVIEITQFEIINWCVRPFIPSVVEGL